MPAAEDLSVNFPFTIDTGTAAPDFSSTNVVNTPPVDIFAPPKATTPPVDIFAPPKAATPPVDIFAPPKAATPPVDIGAPPKADTAETTSASTTTTAPAEPKADASAPADAENKDVTASADASASSEKKDEPAVSTEQPMITADTKIEQPLIVNEQEKGAESQNANLGGNHHPAPYDGYFDNQNHQEYDYLRPGPDELPSPDFNKQVFEFDDMKQIWHQTNYNERVKVEAEIMVTLEALKTQVRYMAEDLVDIKDFLTKQYLGVKSEELVQISLDV